MDEIQKQRSHFYNEKQVIAFLLFIIVIMILYYLKFGEYLNISYIHGHIQKLKELVQQHYITAVFCYMGSFIAASACSIPGSSVFTTAGGVLFGLWPGLLYAVSAATIGAVGLFLAARYCIGGWVQRTYADRLKLFNQEIVRYGHYYLLVMRLMSILPFFVINMLSGLTVLSLRSFVWVTFIGLLPVSLVYVYAGTQLAFLKSAQDFFSPTMISSFAAFIVFKLALAPVLFKIGKRFYYSFKNNDAR